MANSFTALVLYDPCETNYVTDLQIELAADGINTIAVPRDRLVPKDLPDIPFLLYTDPLMRISKTTEVCEFAARCGFKTVSSGNYTVICRREHLLREHPHSMLDHSHFRASNVVCKPIRPRTDAIPILMVVHKRHEYLPLTMNSLVYSLGDDFPNIPFHILMSKPSDEIKKLCLSYAEKYKNIVLYETEQNVCGAGFNLLMQWLKPERFVIWEEDFILPQLTKELVPYWNRRFNNRLDYYTLVGFSTSKINAPRSYQSNMPKDLWSGHKQLTGNSLSIKTKDYISAPKATPHYVTADGVLATVYDNVSFCMIQGYHIGFNQEMDGYPGVFDPKRFEETNAISNEQKVQCLNTEVTKTFSLSDITKQE